MTQKWLKRLLELVALDTTNPPGRNYRQAMEMLAPWCQEVGLEVDWVQIPEKIAENRVNLLAHRRNSDKPRLLVYSHIDVVPADDDWQPFKPRIVDGKIYGRGVADMKGSLIAFLAAAEAVKDQELPWDLTLMITTDEETNQKNNLNISWKKRLIELKEPLFLISILPLAMFLLAAWVISASKLRSMASRSIRVLLTPVSMRLKKLSLFLML